MQKVILLFLFLALASCQSKTNTETPGDPAWPQKMQKTGKTFQELLPYVYNADKFRSKGNHKMLKKKINNYADSIHEISMDKARGLLGDDPYVYQSLGQLKELTGRAQQAFNRGDFKTSQILLQATTNTCFKCHTRMKFGPESYYWKNFDVSKIETSEIEKANLLVSMRQYEDAKLHLREYISELEDNGKFNLTYENALKYYLMVSLRGQKTVEDTRNFLLSKMYADKLPEHFYQTIQTWTKDLAYWAKNKKELTPTLSGASHVLARNKGRSGDRAAVNNLIAGNLLHQYLMTETNKANKAGAYYRLGKIYDSLILAGYWDLPEIYYEMCIRYSPKTKMAGRCFAGYRNNIILGYSGSRGTIIPGFEYERMEELKKIAGVR